MLFILSFMSHKNLGGGKGVIFILEITILTQIHSNGNVKLFQRRKTSTALLPTNP